MPLRTHKNLAEKERQEHDSEYRKYGIPHPNSVKVPKLTIANLWKDRPEYKAWGYPEIVLNIIKEHERISIEEIKKILKRLRVPCDLGFVNRAVHELKCEDRIAEVGKWSYSLRKP